MALNYDFDVVSLQGTDVLKDPKIAGKMREIGIDPQEMHQRLHRKAAFFRHWETVEALKVADPRVWDCFRNAGFGLNRYNCGAPAGTYLDSDQPERDEIISRLVEQIENTDFRGMKEGEFSLHDFLVATDSAEPITASRVQKAASASENGMVRTPFLARTFGFDARLSRTQRKLQKIKLLGPVPGFEDSDVFRLLHAIHPLIFKAYGKDINKCMSAHSKEHGGIDHLDPNMFGNMFLVAGPKNFPVAFNLSVASRIDAIISDKHSDLASKGTKIWQTMFSIEKKLLNESSDIWPSEEVVVQKFPA